MRSRRTSTARDRAVAALYAQPGVRDRPFCAGTLVGPDDDPDAFLEATEEVEYVCLELQARLGCGR